MYYYMNIIDNKIMHALYQSLIAYIWIYSGYILDLQGTLHITVNLNIYLVTLSYSLIFMK